MRTQKHNDGELSELKIQIEKQVVEDLKTMSQNSNLSVEEIVVIAIKKFRAAHGDYMKAVPEFD